MHKGAVGKISKIALKLYSFGREVYEKHGLILVDTKYEFGFDQKGEPYLIDEVHSPDSSRLWLKESYKTLVTEGKTPSMLDKEIIRSFLKEQGFLGEGDVPQVPKRKFIELAQVYQLVAEKLYDQSLRTESNEDQSNILAFMEK